MHSPMVSIVMPSYNQAAFLGAALDSVLGQSFSALELIVADGGSSDDSVAILAARAEQDSRLRWFSRKDRGPAHALNDALALVRGTYIGWLNSDDLYTPDTVAAAMQHFAREPRCLMLYGHGQHVDAAGAWLSDYPTLPPSSGIQRFQQGCFICQPALMMRRTAYVLLGALDEGLRASFDFEYWLRAFKAFPDRIAFIDRVQAYSRLHESCITIRFRRRVAMEGMLVLARHLGHAAPEWLLSWVDETIGEAQAVAAWPAVQEELQSALAEASPWLRTSDKTLLAARLQSRWARLTGRPAEPPFATS